MSAIRVEALTKTFRVRARAQGASATLRSLVKPTYRHVTAVKGISFQVEQGEALAFLGPNGAGKSTTIKMLTGILSPSSGAANVLGLSPEKDRTKLAFSIGTVFGQKSQLWFHLPPSDGFKLLGAVYEIEPQLLKKRVESLTDRFGIKPYLDTPVRKLSLGERVRCEIVASLLHSPRVLFLDEPTIGLDVVAKREIRTLIEELNKIDGVTIFLTSHDVGDIEKVCKRAIIIHHGTVVVDEPMKTLKHQAMARKVVGVKYARPVDHTLTGLEPVKSTEDSAKYEIDTRVTRIEDVVKALVARGEIEDLTVEDEPLEDLIANVYESRSEEEAHEAAGTNRR